MSCHIRRMETDTAALGRKALTERLKGADLKPSHISKLVNDKITPTLDVALKIEDLTGIPPHFWKSANRGAAMWARVQQETAK